MTGYNCTGIHGLGQQVKGLASYIFDGFMRSRRPKDSAAEEAWSYVGLMSQVQAQVKWLVT